MQPSTPEQLERLLTALDRWLALEVSAERA